MVNKRAKGKLDLLDQQNVQNNLYGYANLEGHSIYHRDDFARISCTCI